MAKLVEEDERAERTNEREQDEPKRRMPNHQSQLAFKADSTCSRVMRSISSTCSIDCGLTVSARCSASSTISEISVNRTDPARKRATATSLAAFSTIGVDP